MKKIIILLLLPLFYGQAQTREKEAIKTVLNNWHKAAGNSQFDAYFNLMTADAVYIGTDPTENWQLKEFKAFAKPYFDKGKGWNFTPLTRNVYFSPDKKTAWFDELLDTQMKICRGSGVLLLQNGEWKIAHYVLSIAIPNDDIDKVIEIKSVFDNNLTQKLKQNNK